MRSSRGFVVVAALTGLLTACESSTDISNLLPDAVVEGDVTASSGDAVAIALSTILANESSAALSNLVAGESNLIDNALTTSRTRTCYDAVGAVVADCAPMTDVRRIVTNVTLDGTRNGTRRDGEVTIAGAVHRAASDTLTRIFTADVETARAHAGVGTANDTTLVTDGDASRHSVETATDSVQQLTWNLPRTANPWPVSGSIVRVLNLKITATRGERTQSREMNLKVTVTFPADDQGNVDLVVNDKTCNLNLVTRAVTGCA